MKRVFNDDDRKSFEEIADLIEATSDLPYHEPRDSTPEYGVCADDEELDFWDENVAILETKTP